MADERVAGPTKKPTHTLSAVCCSAARVDPLASVAVPVVDHKSLICPTADGTSTALGVVQGLILLDGHPVSTGSDTKHIAPTPFADSLPVRWVRASTLVRLDLAVRTTLHVVVRRSHLSSAVHADTDPVPPTEAISHRCDRLSAPAGTELRLDSRLEMTSLVPVSPQHLATSASARNGRLGCVALEIPLPLDRSATATAACELHRLTPLGQRRLVGHSTPAFKASSIRPSGLVRFAAATTLNVLDWPTSHA